jgi:hypothetical protein
MGGSSMACQSWCSVEISEAIQISTKISSYKKTS